MISTADAIRKRASRAAVAEQERWLEYRVRYLPGQLASARHKVRALEAEAKRYGMKELLSDPVHADRAFERQFALAKAMNTEGGE